MTETYYVKVVDFKYQVDLTNFIFPVGFIQSTVDRDGDGVDDPCDTCPGSDDTADADADTVPDGCDICLGDDLVDTDGDGIPNACDTCVGPALDSDGDGLGAACDDCAGSTTDGDGDGVPDACAACLGFPDSADADADGRVGQEISGEEVVDGDHVVKRIIPQCRRGAEVVLQGR